MSRPKSFQLKAYNKWAIMEYKGKQRIIMNRDFSQIRQKIESKDVLSPSKVKDLIGWLSRYLHTVEPCDESLAIATIRASTKGIAKGLRDLESIK